MMFSILTGLSQESIFVMHYKIIFSILLSLIIACKKSEVINDDSRFGTKIMILGHAGMGMYYNWPSNSKESIEACIDIGCDGSEIDVQMTLDSVLVAYHDQDLSTQSNCFGQIYNHHWSEIENCELNKALYKGKFIKLEALFESLNNVQDLYFSFDCKLNANVSNFNSYQLQFIRAIKRLGNKFNNSNHCFIEGPKEFLNLAIINGLKNPLFLISNNDDHPSDTSKINQFFGVSIPDESSDADLNYAYTLGIRTMVWAPLNYTQNKDVLSKKPDIIQTDDPISLLKLCNRFNYESVRP